MREPRLGDDIDDYCVRCKRIMNHAVVSVINGQAAKVRCRTCHSDHDYRHELAPPKVDTRKAALFNEVLKKVNPDEAAAAHAADPPETAEARSVTPMAPMPEEAPPPAPVAAAKPKARGKARK